MMATLLGERSQTRVAALFNQAIDAGVAAERVVRVGRLPLKRVLVVAPADPALGDDLEPEARELLSTPLRSRVSLGTAGLLLGLLSGLTLSLAGVGIAAAGPYYTFSLMGTFGMILGLTLGGQVAPRRDHTSLVDRVRGGLGNGQWSVVVHPTNREQASRAVSVLEHCGGDVIRTL